MNPQTGARQVIDFLGASKGTEHEPKPQWCDVTNGGPPPADNGMGLPDWLQDAFNKLRKSVEGKGLYANSSKEDRGKAMQAAQNENVGDLRAQGYNVGSGFFA